MDAAVIRHYKAIWTLAHELAELTAAPEAMTAEDEKKVDDTLRKLRVYRAAREKSGW